jgi:ornithine cyclodeaminase/alanine dehydrogenase-like protein (mu-crystallin family)
MTPEPRLIGEAEIRAALDMASCIEACEAAFAAYSAGRAATPAVIHLQVPEHEGEVHIKAGYLHGARYFSLKAANGFPRNTAMGLPANDGLVLVFDAETGAPAALLLDHGLITDLRTGAAGGVAARHLAPRDVRTVAVIGTGAQARYQLDALALVRPGFRRVRVFGRNTEHARACALALRTRPGLPPGCEYDAAASVREAVDGAQVVITCTASRSPLVKADWLAPGAHVTALGADDAHKQELDPEVMRRADLLAVDSREQCARIGELHHALAAGAVDPAKAVELGEIVAGARPGRSSASQLTVCDLTGVGVQDAAAASLVVERVLGASPDVLGSGTP